MKCLRFLIVFGILIISNNKGKAQASLKDSSINVVLTALHYGAYVPAGNLDKRFGFSNDVGLSVTNKFASNWLLGIEGSFLFGNEVKETSLFVDISNQDGGIIGSDGKYADVKTFERGFMIVMNAGKLYQFKKPNANSGLVFMAGAGLMQHKIRIEVSGNTVPYLDKEYRKGYDRLTNGLALHQFFGYQYLSNKGLINFYVGLDCYEGFTKCRRDYNFDEMRKDDSHRTDLLLGIRAGWILPLYQKAASEVYFY